MKIIEVGREGEGIYIEKFYERVLVRWMDEVEGSLWLHPVTYLNPKY